MMIMLFTLCNYSNAQVKVETSKEDSLYLKTINFSVYGTDSKTYSHTFVTGYEYPTIQEGFYAIGISTGLPQLIAFYTESNLLQTYLKSTVLGVLDGRFIPRIPEKHPGPACS